jgi:hypothetical protein
MMPREEFDFDATLSYLRSRITKDLNGRTTVLPGYLDEAVTKYGTPFGLVSNEHLRLVKYLETIYGETQGNGSLLRSDFKEWYPKAKLQIDSYYWARLEKFWTDHSILPQDVIRSVNEVTDEIMGYLGDPKDKTSWNRRRGLVMGHVQMGKTTNYSALISKAADAGYRIIIVLAGLTNSLRYQTQVRLDKTFVGKSSVSDATHTKIYEVATVFVGEKEGYVVRHPYCGTSQIADFNVAAARTTGAHEGNFADPILFVTKKHPKVLEQLTNWLSNLRPGEKLDGPMLLIDDEADNASVNTNEDINKPTRINDCIRELIHTTKQSTYIGYTATPFANIFIDPDTTDQWEREDLFPADFIKSLEPPTNYVGAKNLFSLDSELYKICVKKIPDDYEDLLPLKHKSTHPVDQIPDSLLDAIREYVLFRALRIASGNGSAHTSMLVNVSRFNNVQEQVKNHVDTFLVNLQNAIESWAMTRWKNSILLVELKRVWDAEYSNISQLSWDEVRKYFIESIRSINSQLVNMRGSGIDYERAPSTGVHIIAIGGLALARGLTLEGLAISYVLRNVGAADTLLQMGRWFGYRPGFEKLCRIHATENLIGHFSVVSDSVEELRKDFERMEILGKTPFEFGLKVRQSPTGIAITAANKMRSAEAISLAEDFSARHIQAHTIFDNDKINGSNYDAVCRLVTTLGTHGLNNWKDKALVWTSISASAVEYFLKEIDLPQNEFMKIGENGESLVEAYIQDRARTELKVWDVAFPYITQGKGCEFPFAYLANSQSAKYLRSRTSGIRENSELVKITANNAVAFGADDLAYGEDREAIERKVEAARAHAVVQNNKEPSVNWLFASSRTRPLLVVHLLNFALKDSEEMNEPLKISDIHPAVSISMVFPSTGMVCKERRYKASPRLIQMLNEQRKESESDGEIEDE